MQMLKLSSKTAVPRRAGVRPFSSDVRLALRTPTLLRAREDGAEEAEEVVAAPLTALEADLIAGVEAMGEEVLIEAEMGGADEEAAAFLAAAAQAARLQAFGSHGGVYDSVLEELAAAESASAAAVDELEDVEGPKAWKAKPAADPLAALAPDAAAAAAASVASLKLDANELRTLVPADWDDSTVEWFSSKRTDSIPLPEYKLNFLWTEKNIAVAVDQVYSRGNKSPLTEYFFWPRKDAWEEVKAALEARPWISERDKVILLNRLTEVINFWQEEEAKHSVEEARGAFPDCAFAGA